MRNLLESWPRLRRPVAVLSDFDGTLAPIVSRFEEADLSNEARAALLRLSTRPGTTVGIVSGRRLADLLRIIRVPGIWYSGNHGYELLSPGGRETRQFSESELTAAARARDELRTRTAALAGVRIEDKGPVVTLHYREADPAILPGVRRMFRDVARSHRLRTRRGDCVLEVLPRRPVDKGHAVRAIRRATPGLASLIYFGDDVTDRDAFRELGPRGIAVRVGRRKLGGSCSLEGPTQVLEALNRLAES